MKATAVTLLACVGLTLLLAGCSGGDSSSPSGGAMAPVKADKLTPVKAPTGTASDAKIGP